MTALRPTESWDVTPVSDHDVERKYLRRLLLNKTCAHPECDKPTESMHHAWPVGTLKNDSWLVRVPGVDKPVLHAIGLCGTGTTGHHGDLELHRAWIKYEDGVFNWYDRVAEFYGENGPEHRFTGPNEWHFVGPLDPQPGASRAGKKRRKPTGDKPDRRKSKWIRFPVPDDAENGSVVVDELVHAWWERYAGELGYSDKVSPYYAITAALVKSLQ